MSGQKIVFGASDVADQSGTVTFGAQDAATGPPAQAMPGMFELPLRALQSLRQALTNPENLPAIGGTIGGAVGGIGGTVGGMGVGGFPGAVGGAALGGAAGTAAQQLINRAMGHESPGTMTEAAKNIAGQGAIQGGMEAAGGAVTKAAGKTATAVYRGYLKPALNQVDLPKAREIVATAIREALPITKGGEDRAQALITQIHKQVGSILASAKGSVDLHQIANKVRAFAQNKFNKPGVDTADLDAANHIADLIDKHPSLGLPPGAQPSRISVSPTAGNEVKSAVRPNSRNFGIERGAAIETRKAAGHELRTDLERIAPEIGPMNNRERQLIDALEAITKASGREENRNAIFGVPSVLAGMVGMGASATGDMTTGLLSALAMRGLITPAVMSRAAILAERFSRVPGTAPATAVRIAVKVAESEQKGQ